MASENDINFDLELAIKNFDDQIKNATNKIDSFHKSFRKQNSVSSKSVSSFLGNFSASMAVKGVESLKRLSGALIDVGRQSLDMAIDANETASKFSVVYGSIAKEAEIMANSLSKSYGLARTEAKQLLGDTGDLLSGFGFTQEKALDLAVQVQQLSVDLASFTNFSGGAKGASEALTKALLGERESVKALGISIMEEDVQRQMAINNAKGMFFETERQAKAQATLDLALQQSKNALGDYARTQNEVANQERLRGTLIQNIQENIGAKLLPAYAEIVKVSNDWLSQNEEAIASGFAEYLVIVIEKIRDWSKYLNEAAIAFKVLWNVGDVVVQGLIQGFRVLEMALAGVLAGIVNGVSWAIESLPESLVPEGWKEGIQEIEKATDATLDHFVENVAEKSTEVNESLDSVANSFNTIITDETIENIDNRLASIRDRIKAHNTVLDKDDKKRDKNKDKKDKKTISQQGQYLNSLFSLDKQWITTRQQWESLDNKQRIQNTKDSLNTISSLTTSNNKTLFAIGKAAAISTATIDGISAVQKALASAPPPFNFALAALVGTATAANISNIASQKPPEAKKFNTGGIVDYGPQSGDQSIAYVNRDEVINSPRMNANIAYNMAQTKIEGGGVDEIVNAIQGLSQAIFNMNIRLEANDIEIARSVSRGVQEGVIIGESR